MSTPVEYVFCIDYELSPRFVIRKGQRAVLEGVTCASTGEPTQEAFLTVRLWNTGLILTVPAGVLKPDMQKTYRDWVPVDV